MASLISFSVGLICLLVLNMIINPASIVNVKPAGITPWYIWLGGFLGAIFVGYITWVNQQQGVALTFALVVTGQIFCSLVVDHFGLFGSAISTISLPKMIGAVLLIVGIILIKT